MGSCVTVCTSSCSASFRAGRCCRASQVTPFDVATGEGSNVVSGKRFNAVGIMSLATIKMQKNRYKMPINEREIFTLSRSWKNVRRQIAESGANMFLRMFQTSPLVKTAFEKFRSFDGADNLRESSTLRTHGLVVMSAIDEIITNLDDEESVVEMALEQGRSHARFEDLPEDFLWEIETPFLDAVKDALGPTHYRPSIAKLYKTVIRYILTLLSLGFREARLELGAADNTASAKKPAIDYLTV